MTVTKSICEPSRLSRKILLPSRTMTISQGLTERGAHMSIDSTESVAKIVASSRSASCWITGSSLVVGL